MQPSLGSGRKSAEEQAEHIASLMFLGARAGQLLFSTLMVANDRRRYARPVLQIAVLAGVWLESGWLGRRIVRARRYDRTTEMAIDTATSVIALVLSQRGLGDRSTAPWAKNIAIGSALGAAGARRVGQSAGAVAALAGAALATGLRAKGREAHVAGVALAVNDAVSWTGQHIAARVYVSAHRRYASLRDDADALTIDRAAAAASEAERARRHEQLHLVTIDVLRRIASGSTAAQAVAVARAEAGRLRFALRTGGRVAVGLDKVLADAAQTAGLRVELVTAELTGSPSPEATAAVGEAVRRALATASELGGATSAVLRASSDDDLIVITIRDHGRGFILGAGSDHERRLARLEDALATVGGTVSLWSDPESGVRVNLSVPFSTAPQPAAGELAHDDSDITDDRDSSSLRRTFPRGTSFVSRPRTDTATRTRFDDLSADDIRMADRTLLAALLAWRGAGLVTGIASLVAGRGRFRSTPVAVAQLLIAVTESIGYVRRVLRNDRWSDLPAARLDAATAAAVLGLGHWNLRPADRSTWINWAPWSFAANVVCAQAMGAPISRQTILDATAVTGVYALQSERAGDGLANSSALAAFFVLSRFFGAQIRNGAVRLEQARLEAVDEGRRLAEAHETAVQLRLLHDHALQTLETIAGGRFTDLDAIRRRATLEADKLQSGLNRRQRGRFTLDDGLRVVVSEHTEKGLVIRFRSAGDLRSDADPDAHVLGEPVVEALCGAVNEALTNVGKHAGTKHVSVTVSSTHPVTVTVADSGTGFDPAGVPGGFGMSQSIHRRMAEVGGSATTHSAPGHGTLVTLTAPV